MLGHKSLKDQENKKKQEERNALQGRTGMRAPGEESGPSTTLLLRFFLEGWTMPLDRKQLDSFT